MAGMRIFKGIFLCLVLFVLVMPSLAIVPQRIISGMPSITEMLFALELDEQIVGVTTNCNYPPAALEKEKVGGFFMNLEKIVSLKPDLVVMHEDAQVKDVKRFKEHGLPVYTISPDSVIEVMDTLAELGQGLGRRPEAEEIIARMKSEILSIEAKVKDLSEKKVLVIVGYKPLIVVGGNNFIDDVLRYAGADNIAGETKAAYPQYSFEQLLLLDPDYVIVLDGIIGREDLKRDRRWRSLKAIKEDKLLFIDADLLSRPGPRITEAIKKIAEFIHETKI